MNRMSAAAECAGSVASDPRCRRGEGTPPAPAPLQQSKLSPRTPDRASAYVRGVCFTCQQEGHWSKDCPSKKSAGRSVQPPGQLSAEAPECICGAGPCVVMISKTENNPGRKFFKCPAMPYEQKCNFFQWCDSPSPHRRHDVASPVQQRVSMGNPNQPQGGNTLQQGDFHPRCQCGGGWCIILTCEEGEHSGRKYFSCPKKKRSNEQCPFSQWCDEFYSTAKCMERPNDQDLVSPPHGNTGIRYPDCDCGAGRCRLLTEESGIYAGQKYFGCTVKRGQGACNFKQWLNSVEGDHENGENNLVGNLGNQNQYPNMVIDPRDEKPFGMKPTSLNFNEVDVGVSKAGSGKAHMPSPLERCQGDAGIPPDESCRLSLQCSSPSIALKPGKCYRCGKEGHWIADCVESLPYY